MSEYSPFGTPHSSPGGGGAPSHAQWLRRQFSGQARGESFDSSCDAWPDLLVDRRTMGERRVWKNRDPVALERNNLVTISQLVIKSVVDSSLKFGRQLDSDNTPLHQFFVVLDLALRHGLRTSRRLLMGKRELWDLLQNVEKFDHAATDITATVRDLTTVKTAAGRARAWVRLALMQKKLADYIKILVDNKELIAEYYEPEALLSSEEGVLLTGLIVSLNIVDCNLCLKEEDLDSQEGVIDLSYYLRRKEDIGRDDTIEVVEEKDVNTVIDQKNYIEEMNRNLAANITNLQARIESLTNTNALMREDLAISKKKVGTLQHENNSLNMEIEKHINMANLSRAMKTEVEKYNELDPKKETEIEDKLSDEKIAKNELEKELNLEIQMKAEMEMAMKLLEKDVHEKQDTIISLRSQLEDIKSINLEMYTKLAECEKSLTYKSDMIQKLEMKTVAMGDTLQQLDQKFVDTEKSFSGSKTQNTELRSKVMESETKIVELESDIKIERQWRERLQEASIGDKETISNLRQDNDFLRQVSADYENLRQDNDRLKEQVREGELTLEELGQQLSWSKLQVDTMKEEVTVPGAWEKDSTATNCKICVKEFNLARRKHHCRNCGGIFCDACSDNKMKLPSSAKPIRVCDNCYTVLLDRQSKMP